MSRTVPALNHNLFAERTLTWEISFNYSSAHNDNVLFINGVLRTKIAALQNGNLQSSKIIRRYHLPGQSWPAARSRVGLSVDIERGQAFPVPHQRRLIIHRRGGHSW